jgi:hypothetical protein
MPAYVLAAQKLPFSALSWQEVSETGTRGTHNANHTIGQFCPLLIRQVAEETIKELPVPSLASAAPV